MPNDKVQLRREFAENVRQTKTRHNLTNIIKTTNLAVNCNGWLSKILFVGFRVSFVNHLDNAPIMFNGRRHTRKRLFG